MKIVLACPVANTPLVDIRMAAFCASLDRYQNITWTWAQTPSPATGRNALIECQLHDPEVTHLFFLDSDTVPPPDCIPRLLALDKDVAAGMTPIIAGGSRHAWNVAIEGEQWLGRQDPLPEGPFPVAHMGGTTLLIRRAVLEAVGYPWFKFDYQPMGSGVELISRGEDVFFCDRVHECGFEIWVDPTIQCDHFKYVNLLTLTEDCVARVPMTPAAPSPAA